MNINPSIFKAYDIRGIYPTDINEENIVAVIRSIYTVFVKSLKRDNLTIVLGRDMRVSSPALYDIAKDTLVKMGAHVVGIGLATTPTIYYATRKYGYDAGIQISASHNPKEYNGIKIVRRDGDSLLKVGKNTGMADVKKMSLNDTYDEYRDGGSFEEKNDVLEQEVKDAIALVKPTHIKGMKVVADAANAMGSLYIKELAKQMSLELVEMNFELDGTFPAHQADPLQFNLLKDLQSRVLAEKADAGLAPDGDGDRIFFINEKGEVVPATLISSLIAKQILEKNPGETVLVDVRYTRNVTNITEKYKGNISYCKVGHALITEQLNKENGAFAGESSGHFYFREMGGCESAVRVVLYVLEAIGREGKPLSQILESLHTSIESGEYNFELHDASSTQSLLDSIEKTYSQGTVSKLDGISIDYPDWRVNIRTSNTEPLLRINVEGTSKEIVDNMLKELTDMVIKHGATAKH